MTELDVLLEGIPQLRALPPEAREELAGALTRRTVSPGEYLFRQGEGPPDNVYYLISATAEILVGPPDDERAVSLSRSGQLVGWLTVFTTDPFPASARVVEPGEVIEIRADVLRRLLQKHPAVGSVLAATMARRLEDLFEEIRAQAVQEPILGRSDTFAFRRRVSEVMSSPVVSMTVDASARDAALTMQDASVSSVLITEEGVLRGIVTEKDLVQKVMARGLDPDRTALAQVMASPVITMTPDSYVYKALGVMRRHRIRHLPVTDGDRVVGMISMRALMALGSHSTLELVEQIEASATLEGLAQTTQQVRSLCLELLDEGVPADEVSRLLSHINRDVHRRVLELAMEAMEAEGLGPAPVTFCFIVMGSHGRAENHFFTDQDHGMILADYPPEDWHRVEPYFMELSGRLSEGLARVGFPLCRGNVMSSNPVWRKPATEWKQQVLGWFANPNATAIRYTTLFYDFVPIWGDASLAHDLRDFITRGIQRNFQLLRSLFDEASHHRVPLTIFKNFVTERSGPHKGEMDLKRSGLLFLVECARILALRHGISETSTLGRLQALADKEAMPRDEAEFIRTAYKTLVHFLLHAQAEKIRAGEPVDNYVNPQKLPIQERYLLRHALEATSRLQSIVHASFGDVFF